MGSAHAGGDASRVHRCAAIRPHRLKRGGAVPVLYTLSIAGDPDDIVSKVERLSDEAWGIVADHGFIGETIGRTQDGVVIAEVWESHAGFQTGMSHPTVAAEFARLALPEPRVDGPFEVLRDFHPGRAV
jgi:hypothetical protein